jgi:hypothetical protein
MFTLHFTNYTVAMLSPKPVQFKPSAQLEALEAFTNNILKKRCLINVLTLIEVCLLISSNRTYDRNIFTEGVYLTLHEDFL